MAKNIRINLPIRLRNLILALLLAITLLSGLLLAVSAAEQKPVVDPHTAALQGGPPAVTSTLYYKSALGLMPPAYVLDPNAPPELETAAVAPTITFLTPYTIQTVGSWPQVIAAAELTGDALNDLAIPTGFYFDPPNDEQLHILGQGDGAFSLAQQLTGGADPSAIVATDINLDHRADVVVALAGDDTLAVYPQTMTTTTAVTGPNLLSLAGAPDALTVGDFTGDMYDDLAALAPQADSIRFWQADPAGPAALGLSLSHPSQGFDDLAVGDLDNDGDDDLAALRGSGYTVDALVVYLQEDGAFPVSYTLSPQTGGFLPHSLAVGDITNDGLDDIVVTAGGNTPDAYLNVFPQTIVSPPSLTVPVAVGQIATTSVTYPAYHLPGAVQIGDLNHDGRDDVVLLNDGWRTLSYFEQNGSQALLPYATTDLPYVSYHRPDALALADLNGNGGLDVGLVGYYHDLTLLYSKLTAPTALIHTPEHATTIPFGFVTVTGTVSAGAVGVEVRLKGAPDNWQPATLNGDDTWQITLPTPAVERFWWVEARAIDGNGHYQSPPDRHRIKVAMIPQPPSTWADICVPQRMTVTGIGMGDINGSINPQSLALADPAGINSLLVQVAGRGTPAPNSTTFTTTAPQLFTLNGTSSATPKGYTIETYPIATGQITASVNYNSGNPKTPRGLIAYAKRATTGNWTSLGKTMNEYVFEAEHTEVLTIPTLPRATDLLVTAVVIDNDDDNRTLVVEATAGGVTTAITETGPTEGDGLNLVTLILPQVVTGTGQVTITVRSPNANGDSLVWTGLNVGYSCSAASLAFLQGAVDMQGRPPKPDPAWSVPLAVSLTPAGQTNPAATFAVTTDTSGRYYLGLEGVAPGQYDITVKGNHTLRNLAPDVTLTWGDNAYFFDTLVEGDVETATTFNQVLQPDADLLIGSFNRCQGQTGFVANADLDESGCVWLPDFGLLSGNFGLVGDRIITPTMGVALAALQAASRGATLAFNVDDLLVDVGDVVSVAVEIDPHSQPVNGVMVHLDFDPTLLELVDVTLTDKLPIVLEAPVIDNQQGEVRFAAGLLGQTLTEPFTAATVSLMVKQDTSGAALLPIDLFGTTDVSGPPGSVLSEAQGITLRTMSGDNSLDLYLPMLVK